MGRKASKKEKENLLNVAMVPGRVKKGKAGSSMVNVQLNRERPPKPQRVEPLVKEEGEMSDNEEVYEKFKEEKWMEWCEDVMVDEIKTLGRLQRLQTTSANLPKEKVHHCYVHVHFTFKCMYLYVCFYLLIHYSALSFLLRCFQKFEITYSF